LLAFEAELANLPRSLITAIWEAIDTVRATHLRTSTRFLVVMQKGLTVTLGEPLCA
jgi:hypothetical protein